MDKTRATGLLLISAILLVYYFFFAPDPSELAQQQPDQVVETGTAEPAQPTYQPGVDTLFQVVDSTTTEADIPAFYTLQNENIRIEINSVGGTVAEVEIIPYKTYENEPLILIQKGRSNIIETVDTQRGLLNLGQVTFRQVSMSGTELVLQASAREGGYIRKTYRFDDNPYVVKYHVQLSPDLATTSSNLAIDWSDKMPLLEKGLKLSRLKSTINYADIEGDVDDLGEQNNGPEEFIAEGPLAWINHKQKFFNSAVIAESGLYNGKATTVAPEQDTTTVKISRFEVAIPLENGSTPFDLRLFFGPNERDMLATITPGFEDNVYYGWFLVRPINKFVVAPLFHLLENVSSNYGIVILLLVLLIKTILFPLQYKAYTSQAKQRVLKPELDELRKKNEGDFQKQQQETMKLYSKVGVSPLSGCVPMLVQMPVFIALFYYFPNIIDLRGKSFLWAEDLSTFDSPIQFGFDLPFLGDHLSLFTLLFTLSQLAYTYYNQQNTPSMGNPAQQVPIKIMGYAMPIFFMFFFNDYASGLTYYYFVSNLITVGQQVAIRNIIDDSKIKEKLEANRIKNEKKEGTGGKKSKLMQRLEAAQKMQEEAKRKRSKS